jgi:uncharacterized membrane protein
MKARGDRVEWLLVGLLALLLVFALTRWILGLVRGH